jgi:hypothetical protein
MDLRPLFLLGLGVTLSSPLFAAKVIKVFSDRPEILLSQDKDRPWIKGDRVCIYHNDQEVGCGNIVRTLPKRAYCLLTNQKDTLRKKTITDNASSTYLELVFGAAVARQGDSATLMSVEDAIPDSETTKEIVEGLTSLRRKPASEGVLVGKDDLLMTLDEEKVDKDAGLFYHGNLSDLTVGFNYIYPTIHYQQAVSDHFTLGLMPIYLSTPTGTGTLTGLGGYLTLNYYGLEAFHGLWIQAGGGAYSLNTNVAGASYNYFSPAVVGTVGYRWYWESGLNFGFGVGVQYLFSSNPSGASLDFSGLLPSIAMDIGFAF